MSTVEERRSGLLGVAQSLNTARFEARPTHTQHAPLAGGALRPLTPRAAPQVPEAPLAEVIQRLEAKDSSLVVLDTRSAEERSVSTIPGSISKADFEAAGPGAYKDKEIVTFCTVNKRGAVWRAAQP